MSLWIHFLQLLLRSRIQKLRDLTVFNSTDNFKPALWTVTVFSSVDRMGTLNYSEQGDLQNLVQRIQNMEMMDQDLPTRAAGISRARRRPALVPHANFGQGPSWVAHINMQWEAIRITKYWG